MSLSAVYPALVGVVTVSFVVFGAALVAVVVVVGRWLARRLGRREPLTLVVRPGPADLEAIEDTWPHPVSLADVRARACGPCSSITGTSVCICAGNCGRQGCQGAYSLGARRR